MATPVDSKVLVQCAEYEENVSYWATGPSNVVWPVLSAEACEAECIDKKDTVSCGAWTWGKKRHVFGLTDVCLLQALPQDDKLQRRAKDGVVSGVLSERKCDVRNSTTPAPSSARASPREATTTGTPQHPDGTTARSKATTKRTHTSRSTEAATTVRSTTSTAKVTTTTQAVNVTCAPFQEDIDFWTEAALRIMYPVSSTEDCALECALDPECGAWTWGKARDMPGATDTCFLKRLDPDDRPILHRKTGMVSGISCALRPSGIAPRPDNADLFCYSLMLPASYEVDLITMQYDKHIGIFACDEWEVYSNKAIEISEGVSSGIVDSDLKCGKGGEFGTALNKGIFEAVWDSVVQDGRYLAHAWTVKVDPDCVFYPDRLRAVLRSYPEDPDEGMYLNNCKFGMHGPLEVFSRNAATKWHNGVQECESYFLEQCSGDCLWGEDMFIDQCLLRVLGVQRLDEFGYMIEDHCDPPDDWDSCRNATVAAFHPFKEEDSYMDCWNNAKNADA